jgi:hypothetical protein
MKKGFFDTSPECFLMYADSNSLHPDDLDYEGIQTGVSVLFCKRDCNVGEIKGPPFRGGLFCQGLSLFREA